MTVAGPRFVSIDIHKRSWPSLSRQCTPGSGMAYARGKKAVDIIIASLALGAVAPVLFAAALAVRITGKGPVIFRQIRVGAGEVPFVLLKLRTMRVDCDDREHRAMNTSEILGLDPPRGNGTVASYKLDGRDPRITTVGRVLRQLSIDELPQLVNVLKGEMSLVGPRPSLPWEVELYTPEQRRRHTCLPGITGLWQVSGRDSLSMPEMLDLDLVYVNTRSMRLDLSILLRTPLAVVVSAWQARKADR